MNPTDSSSNFAKHSADRFRTSVASPRTWHLTALGQLAVARMLYNSISNEDPNQPITAASSAALSKCHESFGLAIEGFLRALAAHRRIIWMNGDRLVVPEEFRARRLDVMTEVLGVRMGQAEKELLEALGRFLVEAVKPHQVGYRRTHRPTRLGMGLAELALVAQPTYLARLDALAGRLERLLSRIERDRHVGSRQTP